MSDRTRISCLAALSSMLLATTGVAQKPAITADQVIALNVAGRGGMARLEDVKTQRLIGHITFASGIHHPFLVELARPGSIRTEITLDGGRIVQAYDGKIGWTINPVQVQHDTTPRLMPAGETQNVAAGGDMDGPLVNYVQKGNHVTYAGIDTADGRPAYKLDVLTGAGLTDTYYIDTTSHLQTKWQGRRVMDSKPVVFESYFRDYRSVNGVMFAYRIDSGSQHIVLDTVQVNVPVPGEQFAMPTH